MNKYYVRMTDNQLSFEVEASETYITDSGDLVFQNLSERYTSDIVVSVSKGNWISVKKVK